MKKPLNLSSITNINHLWQRTLEEITIECRRAQYFLSRADERAFHDQAAGDWRAGDEMVDTLNNAIGVTRNRLLDMLAEWVPPGALTDISEIIHAAIQMLDEASQYRDWGDLKARKVVMDALQKELSQ